ncbi:MAG: N-acetylmuramoyl-L-alanine amidase family protein [Opitutaceae bacterium]
MRAAMAPAAFLFSRLLLALLVPLGAVGADGAARSTPTRPGAAVRPAAPSATTSPLAGRKIAGLDYVSVADVASRLDLKLTWIQRGRKLKLTGPSARADIEHDTRDISVNGLRVFLGDPVGDAGGQLYVSRVDFERCLTPLLRPGFGTAPQPALKTIVLDPGHGGKDNGTSIHEKTYALDVAKRTEKLLEAAGYNVVLTRPGDTYVDLTERSAIANAKRAGLFVSIHFNAVPKDTRTSGVEIFTFAPSTQHAAEWWSVGKKHDPHLETEAMPVNRFDHWSVVLAQALHRRFVVDLKSFDRGKKIAHWGVLRQLNCPGVLIECGFLTSAVEAKKIATAQHRQKIAAALAAGIRDYAEAGQGARRASAAALGKTNSRRSTN